jgi:putative DNA primase/helicase
LAAPAIVTDATDAYLEAQDATAAWIDDCVELDANAWTPTKELFASWSIWAKNAGEFVGTRQRFAENIETKGVLLQRRHAGRGFLGARLRSYFTDGDESL